MKAIFNGKVIAESDETVVVEGNHYFPHDTINSEYFRSSSLHSECPWKGQAHYYHLQVNGQLLQDGAWFYPDTKAKASHIKNYVAFYTNKGVKVEE